MSATTKILGLVKPGTGENFNLDAHFNANWDKLESTMGPMKERYTDYNAVASNKVGDFYTTVVYSRIDTGKQYMKSVLTNAVNGYYTKDTWTFYDTDGLTVTKTITWTLAYDVDGNVIQKTAVIA
jgi:hypothetical protein